MAFPDVVAGPGIPCFLSATGAPPTSWAEAYRPGPAERPRAPRLRAEGIGRAERRSTRPFEIKILIFPNGRGVALVSSLPVASGAPAGASNDDLESASPDSAAQRAVDR